MDIGKNIKSAGNYIRIGLIVIALIGGIFGIIFGIYEAFKTNETSKKTLITLKTIVNQQHITDLNQKSRMLAMNNELKTLISERNSRIDIQLAIIQKSVHENQKNYLSLKTTLDNFINRFVMVRTR